MDDEDMILGLGPTPMPSEYPPMDSTAAEDVDEGVLHLNMGEDQDVDAGGQGSGSDSEKSDGEGEGPSEMVFHNEGDAANYQLGEEDLLAITSKKEAKQLGKKLYKKWKKLQKKASSSSSKKSKSSKKKSSKSSKSEPAKKKKSSSRKKAKSNDDDLDDGNGMYLPGMDMLAGLGDTELSPEAAEIQRRLQQGGLTGRGRVRMTGATTNPKRVKTPPEEMRRIASDLVARMKQALKKDEAIIYGSAGRAMGPPLYRVALKEEVAARCRQRSMIPYLVREGILGELAYWMFDLSRGEAAPYDLRTTALQAVNGMPFEGELATKNEDLHAFVGISRDELSKTDLGRALNSLRKYRDETLDNKTLCSRLLARCSRAFSGQFERKEESDEEAEGNAVWKCKGDPTIASPFSQLETSTEAFQKSFLRPDPRDPTSYNNLLPWRSPAATVTNISGTVGRAVTDRGWDR